jgi:hypothetical protein
MLNYDYLFGGIIRAAVCCLEMGQELLSPGKVGRKSGEQWLDSSVQILERA